MISREFVEQLFKTSTIQRWTDHIRPLDLTALGKHAHTLTIAWILGRQAEMEANNLWLIDWDYLIRGSLYELLRVSVLTDIKSPVLDEIHSNPEKWERVNKAVIDELNRLLPALPEWFSRDMKDYYNDLHASPERWNSYWVLRAASALATAWEFRLIETLNPFLHDLAETKQHIDASVRVYQYIPAVLDVYENRNDFGRFYNLCGRLRFQLRWSQTPILPTRPVLDHELIVAYLAYAAMAKDAVEFNSINSWERYHVFFGAIFHDLPEVLTRDVISPVKSIDGGIIGDIVNEIEREWFKKTFSPMLPKRLYYELNFLALDEFKEKVWPPKEWPSYLPLLDVGRENSKHHGSVIEACDKFAGFMEAYYSFTFGVTSPNLRVAIDPPEVVLSRRKELNAVVPELEGLYDYFTKQAKQHEEHAQQQSV